MIGHFESLLAILTTIARSPSAMQEEAIDKAELRLVIDDVYWWKACWSDINTSLVDKLFTAKCRHEVFTTGAMHIDHEVPALAGIVPIALHAFPARYPIIPRLGSRWAGTLTGQPRGLRQFHPEGAPSFLLG